jgi:hypothetical protein
LRRAGDPGTKEDHHFDTEWEVRSHVLEGGLELSAGVAGVTGGS